MYKELEQAWEELISPEGGFAIETRVVRGIPIRCYKHAPPCLRDMWLLAAGSFTDRDYLIYEEGRLTYGEAAAQVASIANWLIAQGVGPGDRVAIAMRNYPEWMLAYWAILSTGAAVVGMNAWWIEKEMLYALQDSTPKALICDSQRLKVWEAIRSQAPSCKVAAVRTPSPLPKGVVPWSELLTAGGALPQVSIDPDDDACIFYTSGTTGLPKGAQLTHMGCVSNVMNMAFSAQSTMRASQLRGLPVPAPEEMPVPVTLLTTPLFHVTANNCAAQGTTAQGGKLVHMYRWDPALAIRLIERERVTTVTGVPVMSRELISHPDFASADTSSLMMVGGGGAQLQPDLVGKIDAQVETARPNTGYGMTEVCGIITAVSGDYFVDKPESCGRVMPSMEYRCVNDAGQDVPTGEVGELWVRGAPVIKGYLNRPEETASNITDGWLHTGDLAKIDEEEFVFIVDRKKDMILRGGENIFCAEVESAIFSHPAVKECVAFGVLDDRLGEEVGAAIVPADSQNKVTGSEIRKFCKSLIAPFKIPRYLWFLDQDLPRNANGKFVKRELRSQLNIQDADTSGA